MRAIYIWVVTLLSWCYILFCAKCSLLCASKWADKFWSPPNVTFAHSHHTYANLFGDNGHCLQLTMTALPIVDFGRVLATENNLYDDYVLLSRTQRLDTGYLGKYLRRISWTYDVQCETKSLHGRITSLKRPISSYRSASFSFCVIEAIERISNSLDLGGNGEDGAYP